ncbi:MAG TPA: PAS domain S-box protein [Candidatus Thermoplasmatota archaeon]|nr:PAS domain S-box protein [Candidatus Thermoplasmatota archaeon]
MPERPQRSPAPRGGVVLQDIAQSMREACGWQEVSIHVFAPDGAVQLAAAAGLAPSKAKRVARSVPTAKDARKLLSAGKRLGDSRYLRPREVRELDAGTRASRGAAVVVPLRGSGRAALGFLLARRPSNGKAPTTRSAKQFSFFAKLAALAVENAALHGEAKTAGARLSRSRETLRELYREAQRRAQELETLNAIGRRLALKLNAEALSEAIREELSRLMSTDSMYVCLYREREGLLEFPLYYERGKRLPRKQRGLANGLTEYVIRTREPLLIAHDYQATCRKLGIQPFGPATLCWLGVPLLAEGQVVGVIGLWSDVEDEYDAGHVEVVRAFASQAAVAIRNAQLYEQQKRAEEALSASRERLRSIVENSTNLFYVHTPDHVITYVSPRSREFLGCDPEEAKVRWTDFVTDHPANAVGFALTQRALATGERQPPYELELRRRDGKLLWVEVNEAPVVENGTVTGIVGALTDITERRQAEESLRLQTARYEALLRAQSDLGEGVLIVEGRRFTFANDAFCALSGYPRESLLALEDPYALIAPEDRPLFDAKLRARDAVGREGDRYESRLLTREGRRVPVEVAAKLLEDGGAPKLVVLVRDLTARKAAEAAAQEAEERLHTVVASAPIVLFAVDRDLRFTLSEGRGLSALGWRPGEVVGRGVEDVYSEEPWIVENVRRALAGESFTAAGLVRGVVFETQYAPLRAADGTIAGVLGVATDVTERHHAQAMYEAVVETPSRARAGVAILQDVGEEEGRFVYVNDEFARVTGHSTEALLSMGFRDLVAPESLPKVREIYARRSRGEEAPATYETFLLRADGASVPVEISAGVTDIHGKLTHVAFVKDITDRKRAEQELIELKNFNQDIVENSPVGIAYLDGAGVITYENPHLLKLMGRKEGEVPRGWFERIFDLPTVRSQPAFVDKLSDLLAGKPFRDLVIDYVTLYGRHLVISVAGVPLLEAGGGLRGAVLLVNDVTEKAALEAKLRQYAEELEALVAERTRELTETNARLESTKRNLETIFSTTIDGLLLVDRDKRIVAANSRFCEIFGIAPDEVERAPSQAIRDKARSHYAEPGRFDATLEVYETGGTIDQEIELVLPRYRVVHEHSEPIRDTRGEYLGRVWTYRDVTEKKRLERDLDERNRLLATIMDNSADGILALDPEGRYLFSNRRWLEMAGLAAEATSGAMFPPAGADARLSEVLDRLRSGAAVAGLEVDLAPPQGERVHAIVNAVPIVDGGRVDKIVVTLTDITERKKLEDELIRYTQHLEEEVERRTYKLIQSAKMAALGQLVAGVAHEINNPLAFVKSNTENLLEFCKDFQAEPFAMAARDGRALSGQDAQEFVRSDACRFLLHDGQRLLENNLKGLDRISQIVLNLKNFASPQADKRELVDLNANMRDTVTIFAPQFRHRIRVVEELSELPPVRCDGGQINQVVMNMLVNAAQAIEDRGTIWLRTRRESAHVVIEIEDTGSGIRPEALPKIFDPFFTTKEKGSTGLGLSISYNIIKAHGGEVNVTSKVGEGTKFAIRLPIERAGAGA